MRLTKCMYHRCLLPALLTLISVVDHLINSGENAAEAEVDPRASVDALLEVHTKNHVTVKRSVKREAEFFAAFDKACRSYVNENAATDSSVNKSPELLAKQADALLRKSNKVSEESDLEAGLNRVVRILNFLLLALLILISAVDGHLQVHHREGRLPELLLDQTLTAPYPRRVCV